MKIAVALAVIVGSSAFAAPTGDLILKPRTKKSTSYPVSSSYGGGQSYGAASYGPPCSGAPLAPIALYLAPQNAPHYREDDVPEEHSEHARSYDASVSYGAASAGYGASAGGASLAPAAAGGAVGYFPHAKIGGCGVPLLLSCAPNVVAGHLAKAHAAYPAIPSYKQTEKQEETTELREAMEKPWSDAERAAISHAGHHHHHLISVNENHEALAEHTHGVST